MSAARRLPVGVCATMLAMVACHADAAPPTVAHGASVAPGEWTLMRFLGGPPADGQITDTLHVDPAVTARHVRIERNRAGAANDAVCEVDAADDAVWSALIASLSDADLAEALAHPDRMPGLVMDAGYFACTHGAVRIAVSDMAPSNTSTQRELDALRRLGTAYGLVVTEAIAQPACQTLR